MAGGQGLGGFLGLAREGVAGNENVITGNHRLNLPDLLVMSHDAG